MAEFDEIYSQYHQYIYHYVLGLCRDANLAEEITQDTFFKVLKKLNTFRGDCKLNVWICQIAKNTYLDYVRKKKTVAFDEVESMVAEDNIEQKIEDKDMAICIHHALHKLEEPYKEVFWMRTFGELSFGEIAKIHGKTESWARVIYHRAKLKIKEVIG